MPLPPARLNAALVPARLESSQPIARPGATVPPPAWGETERSWPACFNSQVICGARPPR